MQDMAKSEIWTIAHTDQGDAVLLRPLGMDLSVPIFIGQFEAQAILIGLGDVPVKRPLTHDLFLDFIGHAGFTLFRIEIYDIKNNTFHARLFFSGNAHSKKEPMILDARPSDAFALSVRCKCPIFVSRKVVELAGVPLDLFMDDEPEKTEAELSEPVLPPEIPETSGESPKNRLRWELNQAVTAEEYERAAEIRDMLFRLEKEEEKGP